MTNYEIRKVSNSKGAMFTQREMFSLRDWKALSPPERLLGVKECTAHVMHSAQVPDHDRKGDHQRAFEPGPAARTAFYCVYRSGGIENPSLEVGETVAYVENGVSYLFGIPDVGHPAGGRASLRNAGGLLLFNLDKLSIACQDENRWVVSVAGNFTEHDVLVPHVPPARGWVSVDGLGFPRNASPSKARDASLFYFRTHAELEQPGTGYHGSISCSLTEFYGRVYPVFSAGSYWAERHEVFATRG